MTGDGDEEAQAAKPLTQPIQPTQAMIDEHNVSHLPYRPWCPACVRGKGKSMAHRYDRTKEESLFPVVSIDYIADHEMPVLVVHDRASKSHFAHAVPSKGVSHPYAERALCRDLTRLGYKKVILKSDGEPAITALVRAVQANWQGQVVPERSPPYESRSNGAVERAVQTVQGQARTLKEALQVSSGYVFSDTSPILAWLLEHAANLVNLFHRGPDGYTPFQRLKGRP